MSFWKTVRQFPGPFWVANTMEIFERMAWYGFFAVSSLYLTGKTEEGALGFTEIQRGNLQAVIPFLLYVLPVLTGALADRFGYRLMFTLAYLVLVPAYWLLGQVTGYWTFFGVFLLVGIGAAMFKPVVVGTVARTTNDETASLGFGIFYMIVNIGGFVGPFVAAGVRLISWKWVFVCSAAWVAVNLLIVLTIFREPAPKGKKDVRTLGQVFGDIVVVLGNGRMFLCVFVILIMLLSASNGWVTWKAGTFLMAGWLALNLLTDFGLRRDSASNSAILSAAVMLLVGIAGWRNWIPWGVGGGILAGWTVLYLVADTWLRRAPKLNYRLFLWIVILALLGLSIGLKAMSLKTALIVLAYVSGLLILFELSIRGVDPWVTAGFSALALGGAAIAAKVGMFSPAALGGMLFAWIIVYLLADTVGRGISNAGGPRPTVAMKLGDWRFAIYLLLLSGFWTMFIQLFITTPNYIRDFVDTESLVGMAKVVYFFLDWNSHLHETFLGLKPAVAAVGGKEAMAVLGVSINKANQVNPELIVNLDAAAIIVGQVIISSIFARFPTFFTLVAGTVVTSVGLALPMLAGGGKVGVLHVSGGLVLFGILVFAVGEMMASPKSQEYISRIAPKGKEAMYMGYYFVSMALGFLFGGILSGQLYSRIAQKMGRPDLMWLLFGILGLATALALVAYDRLVIRRMPPKKDDDDESEDEGAGGIEVKAAESAPEAVVEADALGESESRDQGDEDEDEDQDDDEQSASGDKKDEKKSGSRKEDEDDEEKSEPDETKSGSDDGDDEKKPESGDNKDAAK